MYEQLVFVVPNPIPYSALEILVSPFTLSTWITISVVLISVVTVMFILQYHRPAQLAIDLESHSAYINLVHTFLVGSMLKMPKKNFVRTVVILWILACMILRTAYQGELFKFMKMNKMKDQVRSIEELIEKNISVKLPEELLSVVTFDKRMEKQ